MEMITRQSRGGTSNLEQELHKDETASPSRFLYAKSYLSGGSNRTQWASAVAYFLPKICACKLLNLGVSRSGPAVPFPLAYRVRP
jgi:hypothetical protein